MVIQVEYRMGNKSYPAVMWDAIFLLSFYLPEGTLENKYQKEA